MLKFIWSKLLLTSKGRSTVMITMTLCVGLGLWVMKKNYKPGPLSAMELYGIELNGYGSHAEFEDECLHCHQPMHCLSANRCQTCHFEIAEQRAESHGLHSVLPGTSKCQTCHPEHRGRDAVLSEVPLTNLDHDKLTGFSLNHHVDDFHGSPLVCHDCHQDGGFSAESVDCVACHVEEDSTFIAEHRDEYSDNCLECHDGRDRMASFDHNASFLLDGAHTTTECDGCHLDKVFVGTPGDCVACHEEPELHAGSFGLQCDRCHNATAWAPAQFTQHDFLVGLGHTPVTACEQCHVATYIEYPCNTCHDPGEMASVHRRWEIDDTENNCTNCHPAGRGFEIENIDVTVPLHLEKAGSG